MRERPGRVIVGRHAFRPAIAESFPEVSHGARRQAEGGGKAGGRLPLSVSLEYLPPYGDRHGLWHRWVLGSRSPRESRSFH
jgi:hypothetical protein